MKDEGGEEGQVTELVSFVARLRASAVRLSGPSLTVSTNFSCPSVRSNVPGVFSVRQRMFLKDRAELVIKWHKCNIMRLAELINNLEVASKHLKILEVNGYRLSLELMKAIR